MRRTGYPEVNELVVCKIVKIYPNSAFAQILEYNKNGMIHVSEVASRWVRNIREFLKENQYVVCRVMSVDKDTIQLSVKRVRREEANSKLNEFKKEKKAEKLLELAAKELGKTLDDAYKEIGYTVQEEFGSLIKLFDYAIKNPDLLLSKGIPKKWVDKIVEIAKKSVSEKIYEVKSSLHIICYESNGIEIIKNALLNAQKKYNIEIKYISAPKYMLVSKGKNHKQVEANVRNAAKR